MAECDEGKCGETRRSMIRALTPLLRTQGQMRTACEQRNRIGHQLAALVAVWLVLLTQAIACAFRPGATPALLCDLLWGLSVLLAGLVMAFATAFGVAANRVADRKSACEDRLIDYRLALFENRRECPKECWLFDLDPTCACD